MKGISRTAKAAAAMSVTSSQTAAKSDAPAPRKLPRDLHATFNTVRKFYENKQYKKGIKSADLILKKVPNHGETLAMKALHLYFSGDKSDGHEVIKRGIRCDISSYVCWHS